MRLRRRTADEVINRLPNSLDGQRERTKRYRETLEGAPQSESAAEHAAARDEYAVYCVSDL
jgi:hypothetical protein